MTDYEKWIQDRKAQEASIQRGLVLGIIGIVIILIMLIIW